MSAISAEWPTENGVVVRGRVKNYPWYDRIDPLYEIPFHQTTNMRWERVSVEQNTLEPNPQGILQSVTRHVFSPIRESNSFLYSATSIRVMSLLFQYHQLTTFQLAAWLGISRQMLFQHLIRLFRAGVLNRSIPGWFLEDDSDEAGGSGSVWAIYYGGWPFEKWLADLEPIEWALVTGGDVNAPASQTPTTIRHNMATSEILLKSMEVCPGVIGTWGDRISGEGRMYNYSEQSLAAGIKRRNVGDGVIVTNSGTAIILETAGASNMSSNKHGSRISDKAKAWVAILATNNIDAYVVFVNSNANARPGALEKFVRQGVEMSREDIVSSHVRERGQRRVFVANGYDWFPGERTIDESFIELNALSTHTDEIVPLAPADAPVVMTDLVRNTLLSPHTPDWIRNEYA